MKSSFTAARCSRFVWLWVPHFSKDTILLLHLDSYSSKFQWTHDAHMMSTSVCTYIVPTIHWRSAAVSRTQSALAFCVLFDLLPPVLHQWAGWNKDQELSTSVFSCQKQTETSSPASNHQPWNCCWYLLVRMLSLLLMQRIKNRFLRCKKEAMYVADIPCEKCVQ